MSDLTPEEMLAQGTAIANSLQRSLFETQMRLVDAEGKLAIMEVRNQTLQAKVKELTKTEDAT